MVYLARWHYFAWSNEQGYLWGDTADVTTEDHILTEDEALDHCINNIFDGEWAEWYDAEEYEVLFFDITHKTQPDIYDEPVESVHFWVYPDDVKRSCRSEVIARGE